MDMPDGICLPTVCARTVADVPALVASLEKRGNSPESLLGIYLLFV